MQPSRPPFSNPNPPFRPTTPILIDFFAKEREEQQTHVDANYQPMRVAGIGQSETGHCGEASASSPASAPPVTLQMLRDSIPEMTGHYSRCRMKDATVLTRLDSANVSAATLLHALQTVNNPHSQLCTNLAMTDSERNAILYRLRGIVTQTAGFRPEIRTVVRNANDNPDQLIRVMLAYVRNPNC